MSADSIKWLYSYEDCLNTAIREEKPIMAGFYTTWCTYCRKLDQVTYMDSAVVEISKDFVCLKIDTEKNRNIAYSYGVSKLPTIIFMDPSGRVIWREFGYREPAMLSARMREVLAVFRKSRAADPYLRKAFEEARLGRMDIAIKTMDDAVTAYPSDARLYAARSYFYRYKRDLDAALRDLDMAISINPSDDVVRTMRGSVYHEKGDNAKAIDDFNRAIAVNKWAYEAYVGRGVIYLEQNNPDQAIKNLNTAIIINPRYASGYLYRGMAHMRKGMLDKAIDDLSMAIKLQPDMMNAYANRAAAYMYSKQYDKSWNDVRLIERKGFSMKPEFIEELKRVSGRDR